MFVRYRQYIRDVRLFLHLHQFRHWLTFYRLIAMCVGKQLISFAFGIYLLNWVLESGYVTIVAGAFCGVLFANNLMVIPFMIFGKRIRTFYAGTWLAKMHKKTVKQVMAH